MQPQTHPQAFDDNGLNATLVTLKANDPFRDWDKDAELRTKLAEKLADLVAMGVNDSDELGRRALASMELPQSSTHSARAVGF